MDSLGCLLSAAGGNSLEGQPGSSEKSLKKEQVSHRYTLNSNNSRLPERS